MQERTREGVTGVPSPPLQALIPRYHGYHLVGPPGAHRGLPSSTLTFVISLADPVDVRDLPGPGHDPGPLAAFVAGLHSSPVRIAHEGFQFGIQIDVSPLGARRLFGVPAGELAHSVVSLDHLLGRESATLVDRVHDASCWPERFAVLDEVLTQHLGGTTVPPAVVAAWMALTRADRSRPVTTLADTVGYSRRHLNDLFARELGLSPRTAARVVRFERSRVLLARGGERPLAAVAASAGYYDQAHMAHEWSALAGCPPSAWIREELPSVQDGEASSAEDDTRDHSVRP